MKQLGLVIVPPPNQDKFSATQAVGGVSAVVRSILTLEKAGIEETYLVAGVKDKLLEKEVAFLKVAFLPIVKENNSVAKLLQYGLTMVDAKDKQVVVTTTQLPLLTVATVQELVTHKTALVQAYVGDIPGYPLLLQGEVIPRLMALETGIEGFIRNTAVPLPLQDLGVLVDSIGHPSYEQALAAHSLKYLRPEFKLRICREKPFLGPGTSQLLSLIEEIGAVREACSRMGISYSKGWRMLDLVEEQVGYSVVQRQQGGKQGGSARLTPKGKHLLQTYLAYAKACEQAIAALFEEYFGEFEK